MKVREVMTTDVVTATPSMRLRDLAELLIARSISGAPVVNETGSVIGIISEGDLLTKQAERPLTKRRPLEWILGELGDTDTRRRHDATTVAEAMTAPAITISPDASTHEAASMMIDRRVNRLPVVGEGELLGIVTRADLVRAYLRRDADAVRTIRHDVLRRALWLDPDAFRIEVHDGVATIAGRVDRRSTADILRRLVGLVEGVDRVASRVTWEFDDHLIGPPPRETEPGAASLLARERPRPLHG